MFGAVPRRHFFGRVFGYFRSDARKIALLLSVIAAATLVGLAQVWPLALLVDVILAPRESNGTAASDILLPFDGDPVLQICLLAGSAFLLRLMQETLAMARSRLNARIAQQGTLNVRCDLFRKLQALHLGFHRSRPQGETLYHLTQDAAACQQLLNVWIELVVAVLTLAVMMMVLLSRNVPLTLIALAVVPLLLATNAFFARELKRENVFARDLESQLASVAQRNLSSIFLVQAFRRENCEYGRFREVASGSAAAWWRVQRQMGLYRLCVGVIFGVGAAAIFGYGGYLVWHGMNSPSPASMSVGDLVVFLTYLAMFYEPLCKISGAGASMQQGIAGMERVFRVLDQQPHVADTDDAVELPCLPRTLSLHNVGFSYSMSRPVLTDVTAEVEPGQMIAFVGSSGAGKSTLLNLLPRFFDPSQGSVRLDGRDIRTIRLADLRRHIAVVGQECPMLPTTIAENIAFGRPDATEAQIQHAAEQAGAYAFIQQLSEGFDTIATEAGHNFSGGQRQRIAIARALLTEAPIIIFDEPTSALDPCNERAFTDTLRSLKGARTLIVVSHRLATVKDCDQIFVLAEGQLVEQGTHQELIALGRHYWELARHQFPFLNARAGNSAAA